MIAKGKRTKRPRSSSSTSTSSGGGGGRCGEFSHNSMVSSSPTSSTCTEEDEDVANCLILLARGGGFSPPEVRPAASRFCSRKFTEMAATADGKADIYVYECKTCSRTFPSFQALGGHRASHKKPKPVTGGHVDQKKQPESVPLPQNDNLQPQQEGKFTEPQTVTRPPLTVEIKPKIHECSLCGAEFASGQALGGHMRRHRSATITRNDSSSQDVGEKTRNMLELDLNLPAPPADDGRDAEFHHFSSNQQLHLVFSAAALVGCHN